MKLIGRLLYDIVDEHIQLEFVHSRLFLAFAIFQALKGGLLDLLQFIRKHHVVEVYVAVSDFVGVVINLFLIIIISLFVHRLKLLNHLIIALFMVVSFIHHFIFRLIRIKVGVVRHDSQRQLLLRSIPQKWAHQNATFSFESSIEILHDQLVILVAGILVKNVFED